MNRRNDRGRTSLVLNAVALRTDWDASVRVGRLKYEDRDALDCLRRELGSSHVVRRISDQVEVAAATVDAVLPGDLTETRTGDMPNYSHGGWRIGSSIISLGLVVGCFAGGEPWSLSPTGQRTIS